MYVETLQKITYMRRTGESIADIISRIVTIYAARSEGSEYYELWQEEHSKAKSLEEETGKKDKRIAELKTEIKKLRQLINDHLIGQTVKMPASDNSPT